MSLMILPLVGLYFVSFGVVFLADRARTASAARER
jgi:hypothetical protein